MMRLSSFLALSFFALESLAQVGPQVYCPNGYIMNNGRPTNECYGEPVADPLRSFLKNNLKEVLACAGIVAGKWESAAEGTREAIKVIKAEHGFKPSNEILLSKKQIALEVISEQVKASDVITFVKYAAEGLPEVAKAAEKNYSPQEAPVATKPVEKKGFTKSFNDFFYDLGYMWGNRDKIEGVAKDISGAGQSDLLECHLNSSNKSQCKNDPKRIAQIQDRVNLLTLLIDEALGDYKDCNKVLLPAIDYVIYKKPLPARLAQ